MNFLEAVEQMKNGKKVRRPKIIWGDCYYKLKINVITYVDSTGETPAIEITDNVLATDWEVVEDNADWNVTSGLAEMFKTVSNDAGSRVKVEGVFKKCRDLIMKDIFKEAPKGSDVGWASSIITKRFGDLK